MYAKLLLTAIFWGGTFIAGKIVAQDAGPFSAAFLRFLTASVFLVGFTLRVEGRFPRFSRHQILPVLLLGLTGICFYNVFFFIGLKRIAAGRAALIVATNPIVILILSAYFFRETIKPLAGVGILLSVAGAVVVITKGHVFRMLTEPLGWGELCIFGCVLSWAVFSIIGKSVTKLLSPLVSITYASVVGTMGLVLPAVAEGLTRDLLQYKPSTWYCIFYLGFFGTAVGFVWYYEGIQRLGPGAASQFINFVPISAVILSFWILQEPITGSLLVGLAGVCAGVYLVRRTMVQGTKEGRGFRESG